MLSNPWYATVVVFHVLFAVVGFGALGLTGAYARLVRVSLDPSQSPVLKRYFRPAKNLGARAIYLVPIFGAIALGFSPDVHHLFPYIGIGIWLIATGVASGVLWPAEAKIQRFMNADPSSGESPLDREELSVLARRCERAAMVTSLCFVVALVVMIAQPN